MPRYRYTATDQSGAKRKGTIESTSAVAARNTLLSRQLEVHRLSERTSLAEIELTRRKIKPADVMNFSRQLGAFLRAGVPVLEALDALEEDCPNALLRRTIVDVSDALRAGSSFSDAVAAHGEIFPPYYVGILRSAELTGNLDVVLDQLADYIERDLETRRAIRSALTYPMVIAVMAVITVVVLVVYVLPRFQRFFEDFEARLPFATRLLLGISDVVASWWPVIFGAVVGTVSASYLYFRTQRGRFTRDHFALSVPVIGDIVRYGAVERFCRILAAMMRAGVPVPDAMDAAAEATNNRAFQRALAQTRNEVIRGEGLFRPITESHMFPGAAAQMIKVGEQSGTLDEQLEITARFYADELEHRLKRLTSLFEPAIILLMGLIVGFVAIALVSAMYGIFNQVSIE